MRRRSGFSLVEMILALGLLSIMILTLGLLSLTLIRSTSEGNDRTSAAAVASTIMDRVIRDAQDDPSFWGTPIVTDNGTEKIGKINYEYDVTAETIVNQITGNDVGDSLPSNRLKRVTLKLYWNDAKANAKQGYGRLDYTLTRIVNENP